MGSFEMQRDLKAEKADAARADKKLGEYLRRKREALGLTQSEVAQKLGYGSPQFISNIERGISNVPVKSLRIMIDLYQISADEVIQILLEDKKRALLRQLGLLDKQESTEPKGES
jgi:transcriptional regulator with XRE-family HTH domain